MPSMANSQYRQPNGAVSTVDSRRRKMLELLEERKNLPIAAVENRLVEEIRNNHTLIIVGETGSGKTTQLPQFLVKAGFCCDRKVIAVTQPRRLAAINVAERVAKECGVQLGQKVGYSIRFDDMTSGSTMIKYMTDGLLLREALLDPYLSKYSVIIVDEAHERTIHTDVLLGLLKKVQKARSESGNESGNVFSTMTDDDSKKMEKPLKKFQGAKIPPLRLVIMSASLDARIFSEYFGGAKAVHVQGRQYPVDVFYTKNPEKDYVDAAIMTIFQIHLKEAAGDILVFLTGQEEIESAEGILKEKLQHLPEDKRSLICFPLFASLPQEKQKKVDQPAPDGFRKVILATNVAETSVTISGIKYVIDTGVVKARNYNPRTGIESLNIIPISKAQALQRSGRAGRKEPGKCYRLYPEVEFDKLANSTVPEIKRCNLSNVILQLKALGVEDIMSFDFMEKPARMVIVKSLEELLLLGALTEDYKLSNPIGHQMAKLPLDPVYSKALILATQFNCLEEMLITVAMLSAESIFFMPRQKKEELKAAVKRIASPEGDHITFISVYRSCDDLLAKSNMGSNKEKILKNWCKENFISSRSLINALNIHRQIRGNVEQMGLRISSCGEDMLMFRRCLAASFFMNAASRQPEGSYRALASGQVVHIHPGSVLHGTKPDCVIYNELVRTSQNYIRKLTRIDPLWLAELAPQFYASQD